MEFQTVLDKSTNDIALRVVKSSITGTATSTNRLVAGEPVVLATHTASNDGIYCARPGNLGVAVNNLVIGNVHNTVIEHEALGLVQCYGLDTDANVGADTDTAIIVGSILAPGTNRSWQVVTPLYGDAATGTAGNSAIGGVGGLAVIAIIPAGTISTVTAVGGIDAGVFLRCL